ncbi:Frataxin-like protein, mitochondrial precursor [Obelidium mucronatum]|nr:Frataxin-like protein, mitochondrial precursor [Obelidium mucronatum]
MLRLLSRNPAPFCIRRSTGARLYSGAVTDEATRRFHEVADIRMHSLLDDFDAIGEKCDHPNFDVVYSNGVLTFNTGVSGTYVINKQPPNKQIWLSSPISGPKRFDHIKDEWIDSKRTDKLEELLEGELKTIFKGIEVTITK